MTHHFFEHPLVTLSYYKFGNGQKSILSFHGFGMHGKQFKILEKPLGAEYAIYGFDLFFHKQTKLKDQSLPTVKKGITKSELANLFVDFCKSKNINCFTLLSYSMGTHYATAIAEEIPEMVNGFIAVAPSSINPGWAIKLASKNKLGNFFLEKLSLREDTIINILKFCKKLSLIDEVGLDILTKEIGTAELRFNFYACFTYLRFLETDETQLIKAFEMMATKPIFIFGKHDMMFPPKIGIRFFEKFKGSEVIVLDENHEMINQNFVNHLIPYLL